MRALIISAAAALIGVTACGNKAEPMDEGLKADLAAVRRAPTNQVVVSALEAGQAAAPAPASRQRTPKPVARPAKRPVAQRAVAEAAPTTPARTVETIQAPAPRPTPARAEDPNHGPYKTEAEIFRQMPWIRP